jgi:hypothetical protein
MKTIYPQLVDGLTRFLQKQHASEQGHVIGNLLFNHQVEYLRGFHDLTQTRPFWKTNILQTLSMTRQILEDEFTHDQNDETIYAVIFVSDGYDTINRNFEEQFYTQIKNIHDKFQRYHKRVLFTTLGIGNYLPTEFATNFRNAFASPESEFVVPPLFRVHSSQELDDQLTQIQDCLSVKQQQVISPDLANLCLYRSPIDKEPLQSGQYILQSSWLLARDCPATPPQYRLSNDELAQVITPWCHKLQNKVVHKELTGDQIKHQASIILDVADAIYHRYRIPKSQKQQPRRTCRERVCIRNQRQQSVNPLTEVFAELRRLRDESNLQDLSDQALAKRLAIGTYTGKFHRRILQSWGMNNDDFVTYRNEFLRLLEQEPLASTQDNNTTGQEPSIILLQNQRDVFLEDDFPHALEQCNDPYTAVHCIPLVGRSVKLRRTDSAQINPWLISVESLPFTNRNFDIVSLIDHNWDVEYDDEEINGVVPLFGRSDRDMIPYVNSSLYQLLVTFNTTKNADAIIEGCHSALLAALYVYLLNQYPRDHPLPTFVNDLKDKIRTTLEIVHGQFANNYFDCLRVEHPCHYWTYLVTQSPQLSSLCRCQSLTKFCLAGLYIQNERVVREGFVPLLQQYFYRFFKGWTFTDVDTLHTFLTRYLQIDLSLTYVQDQLANGVRKIAESWETSIDAQQYVEYMHKDQLERRLEEQLHNDIDDRLSEFQASLQFEIMDILQDKLDDEIRTWTWNQWETHMGDTHKQVSLRTLRRLYEDITGDTLPETMASNIPDILLHMTVNYDNNYTFMKHMNQEPWKNDIPQILKKIARKLVSACLQSEKHKHVRRLLEMATQMYLNYHEEVHMGDEPVLMTAEEYLQNLRQTHPAANLTYEVTSDMLAPYVQKGLYPFACQHAHCPYYMIPRNDLSTHLQQNVYPYGVHKTCQIVFSKGGTTQDALKSIRDGTYLNPSIDIAQQQKLFDFRYDDIVNMVNHLADVYSFSFLT